jgi:hypothetical protein
MRIVKIAIMGLSVFLGYPHGDDTHLLGSEFAELRVNELVVEDEQPRDFDDVTDPFVIYPPPPSLLPHTRTVDGIDIITTSASSNSPAIAADISIKFADVKYGKDKQVIRTSLRKIYQHVLATRRTEKVLIAVHISPADFAFSGDFEAKLTEAVQGVFTEGLERDPNVRMLLVVKQFVD